MSAKTLLTVGVPWLSLSSMPWSLSVAARQPKITETYRVTTWKAKRLKRMGHYTPK